MLVKSITSLYAYNALLKFGLVKCSQGLMVAAVRYSTRYIHYGT